MDTTTNNANLGFLSGVIRSRQENYVRTAKEYDSCEVHEECKTRSVYYRGKADALTDILNTVDACAENETDKVDVARSSDRKTVAAVLGWLVLAHGFVSLIKHIDELKGNNDD